MSGAFVVLEGGEGSGKTTQVGRLKQILDDYGIDVCTTREPGGTEVGAVLRGLLLGQQHELTTKAEALLFLADRAVHVAQVIRPALDAGKLVISDRYADSSCVYQGIGRWLGVDYLRQLSGWATDHLQPDLVIVLDIDPEIGLRRARQGGRHDRIEAEDLEFHQRVRAGFLDIALRAQARARYVAADGEPPEAGPVYRVVDASLPINVVGDRIAFAVGEMLGSNCPMLATA